MDKNIIKIEEQGVLPILDINDPELAAPLIRSVARSGISVCEVVFRYDCSETIYRIMKDACPEMSLGAGTIIAEGQAARAGSMGAEFLISPGFDVELVGQILGMGYTPIPGVSSASEVQIATKLGLEAVKLFPAGLLGGLELVEALSAPFPKMKYIPTNGVDLGNIKKYSANRNILACAGTFPAPPQLIVQKRWDDISRMCEAAVTLAQLGRNH